MVAPSEVPPIVRKAVEYLDERALNIQGIFRESASATELKELKAMFDQSTFFEFNLNMKHKS